ncbi:MAG: FHA domain-containing protein [Gemmataceae bacterium]
MPAHLLALNEGANIPVDKQILLLGRDMECDIRLDSRKISRRHCCIARVGDHLVVRDLGSTNGVRINGVRVVEGRLKPGDELTIGNFRYQISFEDRPPLSGTDKPPSVEAMLESSEEPVPLKDKAAPKLKPAAEAGKPKPAAEAPIAPKPAPPLPKAAKKTPLLEEPPQRGMSPTQVLPDDLDLAPASDDLKENLKDLVKPAPPTDEPPPGPPDMEV